MTTKTDSPSGQQDRTFPFWRKRAMFVVGRTRKLRKEQYNHQLTVLGSIVVAAVVFSAIYILLNLREAGDTEVVSCANSPEYCVPFDGFGDMAAANIPAAFANNEVGGHDRDLDADSAGEGAEGVVRGYSRTTATNENGNTATGVTPFIGDRDAPIQFAVISNFACSHCNTYHNDDLHRFINDYVITGQTGLHYIMLTTTAGDPADAARASMAALCAGEQGAFWEMTDELYRLAGSQGSSSGFSTQQLRRSANAMLLDGNELRDCVTSGVYEETITTDHRQLALIMGATGTPAVAYKTADMDTWAITSREYGAMEALTISANGG
ncbi:MAG: thioredoxin domain-containing protein [Chloroflexi bacterium]|nr:thioredoxin domain-containing protein [Chloroflexota bacterium]